MNEIIRAIEAEQMRNDLPNLMLGITLNYTLKLKKVTEKESKCSKVLLLRDKTVV